MLVRDYMTQDLVTIEPEARLSDALNMMRARNVHRLPVVEDFLLIGIASEKDLLYALPSVDRPISWVATQLMGRSTEGSAYSRSFSEAIPINRKSSTTGRRWTLRARIILRASDNRASGSIVTRSCVM